MFQRILVLLPLSFLERVPPYIGYEGGWVIPRSDLDEVINRCRKQSSGMWHRVEMVLTDVSEERIASIFRVEGKNKKIRTRSVRQRR
jgi:hypothetical protein